MELVLQQMPIVVHSLNIGLFYRPLRLIFGDADRRVPAGTYYCIRFYVTV